MDTPNVTVIIPVYNTEKYLRDCLFSVQRQTMGDFEALIVNDRTPDGAMKIAAEFAETDSRFRILEHEVNQGLGCARNTGMAAARGKYLNFLDSDDRIPTDALQLMFELAESKQADMVIGNMAWISGHKLTPVNYIDARIRSWESMRVDNLRDIPDHTFFSGSAANRLIKKQLIEENNIRFPARIFFEDLLYSVEVWYYSKQINSTPRFVFFHAQRDDPSNPSITQTYNEKAFYDRDTVIQQIFEFGRQNKGAAGLAATSLLRILATSSEMLKSVNQDIRLKITGKWFPLHAIRINNMVNELNKLDKL